MKTPKEILSTHVDLELFTDQSEKLMFWVLLSIKQAQIEAYNEAIDDAAKHAFEFNHFYESQGAGDAIKSAILQLKKKSVSKSD